MEFETWCIFLISKFFQVFLGKFTQCYMSSGGPCIIVSNRPFLKILGNHRCDWALQIVQVVILLAFNVKKTRLHISSI